jgi:hypothetical protein
MGTPRAKTFFIAVLVGVVSLFAFILLRPIPSRVFPSPNGYDNFVKAVSLIKLVTSQQYSDLTNRADLLLVITNNADALAQVREGLKHDSMVNRALDTNYITAIMPLLANFKRLAATMGCEGRLAEMEGQTNQAVQIYLEIMQLGSSGLRGGVIIERMVGIALENRGRSGISPLINGLTIADCHKAILTIEDIDARRETFDENGA